MREDSVWLCCLLPLYIRRSFWEKTRHTQFHCHCITLTHSFIYCDCNPSPLPIWKEAFDFAVKWPDMFQLVSPNNTWLFGSDLAREMGLRSLLKILVIQPVALLPVPLWIFTHGLRSTGPLLWTFTPDNSVSLMPDNEMIRLNCRAKSIFFPLEKSF